MQCEVCFSILRPEGDLTTALWKRVKGRSRYGQPLRPPIQVLNKSFR